MLGEGVVERLAGDRLVQEGDRALLQAALPLLGRPR